MKLHHIGKSRSAAALWRRRALQILSGAVLAAAMPLAQATLYTLHDLNSSLTVDPTTNTGIGISNWTVGGVNQLTRQWFWGRMGSDPEQPLNTINLISHSFSGDYLKLNYGNAVTLAASTFTATLKLSLSGGSSGSRWSDLSTVGRFIFTNHGATPIDYHAFQYSNFDLSGNAGNDTVVTTNSAGTFVQSDGGMRLTAGATSVMPTHWQIGPYSDILSSLTNTTPTTLSDSGSGGSGDMTYAREWDFSLAPGHTFGSSLDQNITVPDPGTILLLGAGMLGLAGANRYKRRKNQAADQN